MGQNEVAWIFETGLHLLDQQAGGAAGHHGTGRQSRLDGAIGVMLDIQALGHAFLYEGGRRAPHWRR